jgi:glutamate 5-kinase
VDAQWLVLLSDVDGVLHNGRPLPRIETMRSLESVAVHGVARPTTKGGMVSKLEAARIVGHCGIPMVIANGTQPSVLAEVLEGKPIGTLFVPPRNRLSSKKWWIAFARRQPTGWVTVDAGAARALSERGMSLLPSGVQDVRGRFEAGEFVAVIDLEGHEVARGVSNFSATDLLRIRGMKSAEAARMLGARRAREVIHRDQLVLARELRG